MLNPFCLMSVHCVVNWTFALPRLGGGGQYIELVRFGSRICHVVVYPGSDERT